MVSVIRVKQAARAEVPQLWRSEVNGEEWAQGAIEWFRFRVNGGWQTENI